MASEKTKPSQPLDTIACSDSSKLITSLRGFSSLLLKATVSNFEYYDWYLKYNRAHQNRALNATIGRTIGQIISPCGTGKTRIQICLHVGGMIDLSLKNEYGVFGIASHRLALNRQLCDELVDVMIHCGLSFDILTISSDRPDTKKYYVEYAKKGYTPNTSRQLSSLSQKEIEDFIKQSRSLGRHVLVVSTYNSLDRLQNVGKIDLLTHDEAHNTVREDFSSNILKVRPNVAREYFFTATRKVRANNGGMNDFAFYGPVLIDILPREMLDAGEIACPRIHSVGGVNDETTNVYDTPMLVKNTCEAFIEHRIWIKSDSFSPDEIGAKIIVGCVGIQEMEDIYNHHSFKEFAIAHKVQCFAISSRGGGAECYIDWKKATREEFFTALNDLTDTEDALIFNVDMLSEGIDLPTITGVMPLRNLDTIKLIQLIGRALRLTKKDRDRLYSGEVSIGDYKKYIKPFGHLILPKHLNSCNEYERMKEIVRKIYDEYESPIEEMVIGDKYSTTTPNDLESMIHRDLDVGRDYQLRHTVMDVVASVYESIINKMSAQDRRNYLLGDESMPAVRVQPSSSDIQNLIQQLTRKNKKT